MKLILIFTTLLFFFSNNSFSQKNYKNAEECILDRIPLAKTTEASVAIIEACKNLYPTASKTTQSSQTIDKKKIEQDIKTLGEIMELLKTELNKLSK